MNCIFCERECKNDNSLRNHQRLCKSNPDRSFVNSKGLKGHKPGNQYMKAKELNLPKPVISETTRNKMSLAGIGRLLSDETKKKLSEKLSINNKGGRCKWFEVSGQKVQGTWEKSIAERLNELEIVWIKLKTNKDIIKYVSNGKEKSYTPDFFLPDNNLYLEIKGFWWGDDKNKMDCVISQHPELKVIIIEKEKYQEILKSNAVLAKLVMQWTENPPCPGSTPGVGT